MTDTQLPRLEIDDDDALASARITLDIYSVEVALARVIAEPRNPKNYLEFCGSLRASKLLYFSNDRQEPGTYDVGARLLHDLALHFIALADEAASQDSVMARELARVREGVRARHIHDLDERLATPLDQRVELDRSRLGPDWEPVRKVDWSVLLSAMV